MMTYGSGPQALVEYLQANWQATRAGRPDVPAVTQSPQQEFGVVVFQNRESIAVNHGTHDLIHCYHPQAGPIQVDDRGYNEVNAVETVQIDIECTDRSDPDTGERLSARNRLIGDRSGAGAGAFDWTFDVTFADLAEYEGLLGETVYLLEQARRDLYEWDVTSHTVVEAMLKNSQARMSLDVELEHIARNTAQP